MLMKRIFYIPLIVFLLPDNMLFSQDATGKLLLDVSILAARNAAGGLTYDDIEGSPHYSDGFTQSIVYLKDGNAGSMPLRYDLFQDEIEFRRDEKIFWLIKKDVLYIQYGKDTLFPEPLSEDPHKLTYFFAREKGEYSLYIRKKVSFHPKVPPKGYTEPIPDRFERDQDAYYLKKQGMQALEIRNKKTLLEMLSDNAAALDYIKKSKIKANKEEDLLALIKFLNDQ
jgi:hypothetical protein